MTIAQTRKPGRQDLSQARNGTITGRGGRTQQLGAAAQRRLGQQPPTQPAKPAAWQQLAGAGRPGTGSAAGNRAAAAGLPGGGPQIQSFPMPAGYDSVPMAGPGGAMDPGADPQFQSGGGFMGEPMPFGGGMASYTKPGAIGQMAQGAPGAAGPTGGAMMPGANPKPFGNQGVDSNPFAQVGGTPNGEPLQAAQGRAGQAGRIAQLIQRLRGGGMSPDIMQMAAGAGRA